MNDRAVKPPPRGLFIGLMSGTSLDGVDGVLIEGHGAQWMTRAHAHRPFPHELKQSLLDLNTSGPDELHRSAVAAQGLVTVYAEVVSAVLQQAGTIHRDVTAIGAHGQTVRHRPDLGYTWQVNAPALLAERTGIDVIADFRARDVAAGGQGAPLVPAFHQAIFGQPEHTVVVLNVGGMANLSILRPGSAPRGFDCGPGNCLLDMWCERQTGQPYDANGEWGAGGHAREDWLADALTEPYFQQAPPKSTGRDLFNGPWLQGWLGRHGLTDGPLSDAQQARDVQATLCELTARSAAQAVLDHASDAIEAVVCGGGALNGDLMRRLSAQLPGVRVRRSDAHGLHVMQVEAAAFAWLAWCHVHRHAGNVPDVTGALGSRILGAQYPA